MPAIKKKNRVPYSQRVGRKMNGKLGAKRADNQGMLERDLFILSLKAQRLPYISIVQAVSRKYGIGWEAARYSYRRAVRRTFAQMTLNKSKGMLVEHIENLRYLCMQSAKDGNFSSAAAFTDQLAKVLRFYESPIIQPQNITVNTLALPGGGDGALNPATETMARLLAGMTHEQLRDRARVAGLLPGGNSTPQVIDGESHSGPPRGAGANASSNGEGAALKPDRVSVPAKVIR